MIKKDDEWAFKVQSNRAEKYLVKIVAPNDMPSCECYTWWKSMTPCKHIFAVLNHAFDKNWDVLPQSYRDNVWFTLDPECVPLCGINARYYHTYDYKQYLFRLGNHYIELY